MRREGLVVARSCRVWEDPSLRLGLQLWGVETRLRSAQRRLTASLPLPDYPWPWERHLPLGVIIACMVILVVCVSCYFSIVK